MHSRSIDVFCAGDEEEEDFDVEPSEADLENRRYGRRHWERPEEAPLTVVKQEKVNNDFRSCTGNHPAQLASGKQRRGTSVRPCYRAENLHCPGYRWHALTPN